MSLGGAADVLTFQPEPQPAEVLAIQPARSVSLEVRAGAVEFSVRLQDESVGIGGGFDPPTGQVWGERPATKRQGFFSRALPSLLFDGDVESCQMFLLLQLGEMLSTNSPETGRTCINAQN